MLIAISGKKQSGKSTLAEFLELNYTSLSMSTEKPVFAKFDMADCLKQQLVDIFGINPNFIYGSDQQKNQPTQYKWGDLPHAAELYREASEKGLPFNGEAFLTGREIMQQYGTNICRRMNPNIWVEANIRKIKASTADIKFCCDVRFPSEVMGVKALADTIAVRLTKDTLKDDHESETALDADKFDWKNFNIVIDNRKMSIDEKNACFAYALNRLGYISLNKENMLYSAYFTDDLRRKVKINKC